MNTTVYLSLADYQARLLTFINHPDLPRIRRIARNGALEQLAQNSVNGSPALEAEFSAFCATYRLAPSECRPPFVEADTKFGGAL